TAGTRTLAVQDTVTPVPAGGASSTFVTPAAASRFDLSAPAAVAQGSPFSATLTAYDPYGNVATGYNGTVHFTSSDPHPTLPADFTFNANFAGRRTFSGRKLQALGAQSITATDTVNASLTGVANPTVNPEPDGLHFRLTASSTTTAGAGFDLFVDALDVNG